MNDDQIRELLDDAVSDVEPRPGLDTIRARTSTTRSRRPWVWGAAGAVLATAATIAAVAVLADGPGTTAARPGVATQPTGPASTATERPGRSVTVYFVGRTSHGARLFPESYPEVDEVSVDQAVERSVTGSADDPDYGSLWPRGTTLQRAQLQGGVLSVDLSGDVTERPSGMSEADAELALQQVVRTAQNATGSSLPVLFLLDGYPTPMLLGQATDRPVPTSSDDLLAQVQVASPTDGARVTSPFTVTGSAAAFEANVQWELMQGDTVVKRGFTTAEECCTLSPYSFEVTAEPGTYTLVVHDEDASGGEGVPPWRDTKEITVE